jgi:hypothetical protein
MWTGERGDGRSVSARSDETIGGRARAHVACGGRGTRAADTREDRDVQFLEYDEDVVTPEENSEIRRLFRNSRLKGYIAKKTSNIELQILERRRLAKTRKRIRRVRHACLFGTRVSPMCFSRRRSDAVATTRRDAPPHAAACTMTPRCSSKTNRALANAALA